MKLSASVSQPGILYKLVESLEKVDKAWILSFSPSSLVISIVPSSALNSKLRVFATLKVDSLFNEYICESKADDFIHLQLASADFKRALKSGQTAVSLNIKLSKKQNLPVLTLLVLSQSRSSKLLSLQHDIPVRVLPATIAVEIKEPRLPLSDMLITLPSLDTLRKILERLSHLSSTLTLKGNLAGDLELFIESNGLRVTKTFPSPLPLSNNKTFVQVDVEMKDFCRVLGCAGLNADFECMFYEGVGLLVRGVIKDGSGEELVVFSYHIPIKKV